MHVKYFYKKYFFIIIFNIIIIVFFENCSYQLYTNISKNISQKKDNDTRLVILHSYDPFGLITEAIRAELYKNKINFLDKINNNLNTKNICMYLYVVSASEHHITTSVFSDGTEAGYQLILNVQINLLISNNKNYYPIDIQVHRAFIKNTKYALPNNIQENDIRKLMYQEIAEKIIFHINLKYKNLM